VVGDSKYAIVFDPLLTGHVIRRMRSGRVRIFNGNQWETLSLITQERIGVGALKLCENYRRHGRRVWYAFYFSRTNKPEVAIWRTFGIKNAKIIGKRRQIAEILHSNGKPGSANRTAMSKFTPEVQ